ncbi:MAG: hypothetical protein CM15mP127_03720 [Gammaproteobacteria bacterium]|nr:MAG: hypothetical protein CM15mP127_03720 [Gammaproteobacteria bacterium]
MEMIVIGLLAALTTIFSLYLVRIINKRSTPQNTIELQRFDVMECGPFSGQSGFHKKKLEVLI